MDSAEVGRIGTVLQGGVMGATAGRRAGVTGEFVGAVLGVGAGAYMAYPEETQRVLRTSLDFLQEFVRDAGSSFLDNVAQNARVDGRRGIRPTTSTRNIATSVTATLKRDKAILTKPNPVSSSGSRVGIAVNGTEAVDTILAWFDLIWGAVGGFSLFGSLGVFAGVGGWYGGKKLWKWLNGELET